MKRALARFILLLPLASAASALECVLQTDPSLGWLVADVASLWFFETLSFTILLVGTLELLRWASLFEGKELTGLQGPIALVGWLGSGVFVALLALAPGVSTTGHLPGSATDILLITLDTTRLDALGIYGNPLVQTPVLDGLGRQGVVFEQAVATAPQTGPSHASIFTGRYPHQSGVYSNATHIPRSDGLATLLQGSGWRTGGFVSGYPLHPRFGFGAGFDQYDALFDPYVGWISGPVLRRLAGGAARERRGDHTVSRALNWLRGQTGPVFCWLHLYDPHGPYSAPEGFYGTYSPEQGGRQLSGADLPSYWGIGADETVGSEGVIAHYLEEVAWMDSQIGRFLQNYRDFRPGSTPMIVVVADHGESYLEHGILFDHGDDLFEPAMAVPMLVSGGGFPKGMRSNCLVSTVDILPTVAEVVDLDGIEGPGRPLKSALGGLGGCSVREVFGSTVGSRSSHPPIHHMIRSDKAKYIRYREGEGVVFNLLEDPREEAGFPRPQIGHQEFLVRELERRLVEGRAPVDREEVPEVLQQLEQLGYVDKP